MGKRYSLNNAQLAKVMRLRESGASWLEIQRKSGIPRRVAKRVYHDHEQKRTEEELRAARREVAADEFRKHLDAVTRLAQLLRRSLNVPESYCEERDAERVLGSLWEVDIYSEVEPYQEIRGKVSYEEKRETARQNRMLWKSLQVHTRGRVHWGALDEWKQAWNSCVKELARLRIEASEVLKNILKQRKGLKDRIVKGSGNNDALELMTEGILWEIWQGNRLLNSDRPLVRTRAIDEGRTEVIFREHEFIHGLTFMEKGLAEQVAEVCNWAAENLCRSDIIQRVADRLSTMRTKSEELAEALDPLVLRPLMLQTRCELCPA